MSPKFQKQLEKDLRHKFRKLYRENEKPVFWRNFSLATGAFATLALATFFFVHGNDPDFMNENINDLDLDNSEVAAITNIMQNYNINDLDTLNTSITDLVQN